MKSWIKTLIVISFASQAQATIFCKDVVNPPSSVIGDSYFVELQDGSKVFGTLRSERYDSLELSTRTVGKSEIRRLFVVESAGQKVQPSELKFGDEIRIKLFPSGSLTGLFVRNSNDGLRLDVGAIPWNKIERIERTSEATKVATVRRSDQVIVLTKTGIVKGEVTDWDSQTVIIGDRSVAKNTLVDAAFLPKQRTKANEFVLMEDTTPGDKIEVTDSQSNRKFEAIVFSKSQSTLVVLDLVQNKKIALSRFDIKSLNLLQRAEEISTVWRQ